jgi:hypothetical protein
LSQFSHSSSSKASYLAVSKPSASSPSLSPNQAAVSPQCPSHCEHTPPQYADQFHTTSFAYSHNNSSFSIHSVTASAYAMRGGTHFSGLANVLSTTVPTLAQSSEPLPAAPRHVSQHS